VSDLDPSDGPSQGLARQRWAIAGDAERLAGALRSAPARAGGTRVLGVDGRSGAGKSTVAAEVARLLDAPVVHLEDLYGGWDGLEHGIDLLVSAVLEPLAKDQAAYLPHYDWIKDSWDEPAPLPPPGFLVVEGVGAGARRAARYESVVAWVELPTVVRQKRAFQRDGDLYAPNWERWARQEEEMLAREGTPERADVVVSC